MRLSAFITDNLDTILVDWVALARQQFPAAANMGETALLDHGRQILEEIAANMRRPQGEGERQAKSEGQSASASASSTVPSRSHARQRERQGFEIEQMVAEYRALRATVLRLRGAASTRVEHEDLEELTRFNEAVDQAIAESLTVLVAEMDKARDLFLGILGHDLRGPLSAIASSASAVLHTQPQESHQAVSNLVFNALKHGDLGQPISIGLDGTREETVHLAVKNSGARIPPDLLPMIFEPLVRAADEGQEPHSQATGANLGLGLHIVREIALAHGGAVDVNSGDASTCFALRLPRIAVRKAPPSAPA